MTDTSQVDADAELREDDNLLREVIMEIGRKFNPRLKDHEIRSVANMNHLVTFTRKRLLKTNALKRLVSQPHQDSLERTKPAELRAFWKYMFEEIQTEDITDRSLKDLNRRADQYISKRKGVK